MERILHNRERTHLGGMDIAEHLVVDWEKIGDPSYQKLIVSVSAQCASSYIESSCAFLSKQ